MKKATILFLAVLAGCAQTGQQGAADGGSASASVADFRACDVRVAFSGQHRELREQEMLAVSNMLTPYAKWQLTGRVHERFRVSEAAVCLCRDYPFASAEWATFATTFRSSGQYVSVQESQIPKLGQAIELRSKPVSPEAVDHMRLLRPENAASCLLVQAVRSPSNDYNDSAFFQSVVTLPARATPISSPNDLSVRDRLLQLDQLLRDRLITPDEYKARRSAIIEQL